MDFFNKLKKPVKILAPMVNNSGLEYRKLARKYGADICYTEMVHAEVFLRSRSNPQHNHWYSTDSLDRPLVIQFCGNSPSVLLEAAKKVQDFCDAIDINLGCPQPIARKGHYGAYLQDEWELIHDIVNTLSSNLKIPVFCKIRIFSDSNRTVAYAKMIENAGCSLLVVHGRTREQIGTRTGLADWDQIRQIRDALEIPVIANGNIIHPHDIHACIEATGCAGVMVAETHLYQPGIFAGMTLDCLEITKEYLLLCTSKTQTVEIKSHVFKILNPVLKHLPDFRPILNQAQKPADFLKVLSMIRTELGNNRIETEPYIRVKSQNKNHMNQNVNSSLSDRDN
ncbi:tRNA-dihydrouridine(16/17) synthase [NAD(P)(+)] [Astathelohania contejeani]|uniref:tRNA-dihydrouridine(16/17) synthase [NAD(P)(+)] n=1 Tax=Astathelohania contejeani TaxID=164912 RepID=A0ABQ7I241_9MICR|nr:tRNA-dihydrouridine(16/17) synthase [NAD(P)(+)] [Thelohania contejeani]